jgi:periplasmic divalent cation tolerance protein
VISLVQVTFPDRDTAARIGRVVVEERLAACCNVLGTCRSTYLWDGKVESGEEAVAQFKTAPARLRRLVERIGSMHPYRLPAIEWWEAETDPLMETWVREETG